MSELDSEQFVEDQVPEEGTESLSDDAVPGGQLLNIRTRQVNLRQHLADTRRYIAYGVIGATLLLYSVITVALIGGALSFDGYTKTIAALAPLQALAAATIGFFFGKRDD